MKEERQKKLNASTSQSNEAKRHIVPVTSSQSHRPSHIVPVTCNWLCPFPVQRHRSTHHSRLHSFATLTHAQLSYRDSWVGS